MIYSTELGTLNFTDENGNEVVLWRGTVTGRLLISHSDTMISMDRELASELARILAQYAKNGNLVQ